MLNTLAYVALLWMIARFSVRDVRMVGDFLAINWAAQIIAWSAFQAVPSLAWMSLEIALAAALLLLVSTRIAVIVALLSTPTIAIHAVSYATAQPFDNWLNWAAWFQMAAFIFGGWDNGLGRLVSKMADPDHRVAGYRFDSGGGNLDMGKEGAAQ